MKQLSVRILLLFLIAGCKSAPVNPTCGNKDITCPLGTQKECTKTIEPCVCHCHEMNSNPFTPKQMNDQNRAGFPKEEKPSNQPLSTPFSNP